MSDRSKNRLPPDDHPANSPPADDDLAADGHSAASDVPASVTVGRNDAPDSTAALDSASAPDSTPTAASGSQQLREQKLARIKAAVDAGLYDSDELLHLAMGRMLRNIEADDDSAEPKRS